MAARKRKLTLDDNWRAKISASQIVNKLHEHIVDGKEMKGTQIRAAEILLRKVIPDLQRTEHIGDPEKPMEVNTNFKTAEEGRKAFEDLIKRG